MSEVLGCVLRYVQQLSALRLNHQETAHRL
jgi:hypothetical protein